MPLLPAEPVVSPNNLFADPSPGTRQWWVFQTRPRAEKSFARLLSKSQAAYFLPTYIRTWRKNGRGFRSSLPLFPGYVFASGEERTKEVAFATNLVVREVPARDQILLDRELSSVYHLLGGGESLRPEDRLGKGSQVLIVEGTYAGISGRVLEAEEGLRVCVEISLLGQGVSIPVERWMIKPVDSPIEVANRR
ncbi:MAG: hypothetical protein C0467_13770 [Planctomycetaceae bacterium]|nr:hypothetical protein [Planctomycetaceae bacterium]